MPALLTSRSRPEKARTASATSRLASSEVASAPTQGRIVVEPFASAFVRASSRPAASTCQPVFASWRAIAAPIPALAPVTMAVRWVMRRIVGATSGLWQTAGQPGGESDMASVTRRAFVAGGTAAAMALALHRRAFAKGSDVYRGAIVIDGLGGFGNSKGAPGASLTNAYVKDIRDSGVTCVHATILPVGSTPPDTAFTEAVIGIGNYEREIDAHPDVLTRIRRVADIAAAKQAGRTGIIYGFQDAVAFETDLSRLDELYRLGIRVVQPTYNRRNLLGDGCLEPANASLSKAGVEAVKKMNELGSSWTSATAAGRRRWTPPRYLRDLSHLPTRGAPRRTITRAIARTRNCAPWRRRAGSRAFTSCPS